MRATEVLMKEHESILEMLNVVEVVCQRLENNEKVDPEHLSGIIHFIQGFADKCHHAKEEDLLFIELETSGLSRDSGPLGVMLHEHDEGRFFVRGMKEAADRMASGDTTVVSRFVENARGYAMLLNNHIYKENNILFPMADAHLSDEQQKKLEVEFEKVAQKPTCSCNHGNFLETLAKLKEIYR